MLQLIQKIWTCDKGATAIEYGMIGSLIAIAIIAGASSLGNSLDDQFSSYSNKVEDVAK